MDRACRGIVVTIRVTLDEHRDLRRWAADRGMTVSDYLVTSAYRRQRRTPTRKTRKPRGSKSEK